MRPERLEHARHSCSLVRLASSRAPTTPRCHLTPAGTARCQICKAGTFTTRTYDKTNSANQEVDTSVRGPDRCTPCPTGLYRSASSLRCVLAAPLHADDVGRQRLPRPPPHPFPTHTSPPIASLPPCSAYCDACPAGFQTMTTTGAVACTPCPAGFENNATAWTDGRRYSDATVNALSDNFIAYSTYFTGADAAHSIITQPKCLPCPVSSACPSPLPTPLHASVE